MSHFSVAVIHKKNQSVDDLLAEYCEDVDYLDSEYVEFEDCTDEVVENYENGTEVRYKAPDGTVYYPFYNELYSECTKEEYERYREEGKECRDRFGDYQVFAPEKLNAQKIEMPYKEIYKDIDEFANAYYGYDRNGDRFGNYFNPMAKWDWYEIGGRWSGIIKTKDGEFVNEAYIKDIDFSIDDKLYQECLRYWEVAIDKEPLKEGEKERDFFCMYKPEYYRERYGTKENYAKIQAQFSTYAVVTPDGEWYEPGAMGWFGCSFASIDDERKWDNDYYNLIKNADPNDILTIVDCHI